MKKQPVNKKVRKSSENQQSAEKVQKQSKSLNRKIIFGVVALLLILLCLYGVRSCSRYTYGRSVKEYKAYASLSAKVASSMLDEMMSQWTKVETEGLAVNTEGRTVACKEPSMAMEWKRNTFAENGSMEALQWLMKKVDDLATDVVDAPSTFKSDGEALQTAQNALDSIVMIIQNPGSDLFAFCEKAVSLTGDVEKALDKTDFNFFVSIEEAQPYVNQVMPMFKKKDWAEQLMVQDLAINDHILHALKYRKMGFIALPEGNGVLYKVIEEGHGPIATPQTEVKLHYEGKLMNGNVFDSSFSRGTPVTMLPTQTVRGFNKAITSMPVGSKWEVFIPSDQAYGNRSTGSIEPNSDLLFTIEILELL